MALWLDKHRPTTLDKLTLHENLTDRLRKVANSPQFPHMLFYGPPGSGKRTRIMAVLREMFGASAEKLKVEHREFKVRPSAWRARRPPLGASLTPHPRAARECFGRGGADGGLEQLPRRAQPERRGHEGLEDRAGGDQGDRAEPRHQHRLRRALLQGCASRTGSAAGTVLISDVGGCLNLRSGGAE